MKLNRVTYLVEAEEIKLLNKYYGESMKKWVSKTKDELLLKNVDLLSFKGGVKITSISSRKSDVPNVNLASRGSTVIVKIPVLFLNKIQFPTVRAESETLDHIVRT